MQTQTQTALVWRTTNTINKKSDNKEQDPSKKQGARCKYELELSELEARLGEVQVPAQFDESTYLKILNAQAIGPRQGQLGSEIDTYVCGPINDKDGYPSCTAIVIVHGGEPQVFDQRIMQPNRLASKLFNLLDLRGDLLILSDKRDEADNEDEEDVVKNYEQKKQEPLSKAMFLAWAAERLEELDQQVTKKNKKNKYKKEAIPATNVIRVGPEPMYNDKTGDSVTCDK